MHNSIGGEETTKMLMDVKYPCKALAQFIKYYWIMEAEGQPMRERVVPTGDLQILFHYKKPFTEFPQDGTTVRQPQSVICGQITRFKDVETDPDCGVIGVVFLPYGLKRLLNVPMHEMTDHVLHPAELIPGFNELEHRLTDSPDNERRVALIEGFLLKGLTVAPHHHDNIVRDSVHRIHRLKGQTRVTEMLSRFGVPERRFQRLFQAQVGISPQRYIEIIKFNHARSLLNTSISLTEIAHRAGYYDQPQFIKAFKKYAGHSPKNYRAVLAAEEKN